MEDINIFVNKLLNLQLDTFSRILLSIGIIIIFFIIRPLLSYIIIKIFKIKSTNKEKIKKSAFYKPLKIFFLILGIYSAILVLKVPENILLIVNKLFRLSIIFLVSYAISNALKSDSIFLKKFLKKQTDTNNTKLIKAISSVIRVIVFCFAAVIAISELGYDINGLIAGIGLSGLTISLAAQDTAKNLFGGLVIFFDKPFNIGEWIQTENYEGIVEEITFRSTRIRTWDDSIATIPNSEIANTSIINWTKMNRRRVIFNLTLEFDTKLKQVCNFTNDVQSLLESYEEIINDTIIVKFTEIEDSGYKIYICFRTPIINYNEYMSLRENINYKLMQLLEKNKINLAYPSQSIYIKN